MLSAKTEPALTDRILRVTVQHRRARLAKFRALNAPACVIRDAEELLARGEAELKRRDAKGLLN